MLECDRESRGPLRRRRSRLSWNCKSSGSHGEIERLIKKDLHRYSKVSIQVVFVRRLRQMVMPQNCRCQERRVARTRNFFRNRTELEGARLKRKKAVLIHERLEWRLKDKPWGAIPGHKWYELSPKKTGKPRRKECAFETRRGGAPLTYMYETRSLHGNVLVYAPRHN